MKSQVQLFVSKFLVFFIFPVSFLTVSLLAFPKKMLAQATGTPLDTGAHGSPTNPFANDGSSTNTNTSYHLDNPLSGVNDIGSFIKKILDIVLTIGIPIVAIFIIYSGFLFVVAQGNSEKLSEAKKSLGYTLLGAAILLGSWILAQALQSTVEQLQ